MLHMKNLFNYEYHGFNGRQELKKKNQFLDNHKRVHLNLMDQWKR